MVNLLLDYGADPDCLRSRGAILPLTLAIEDESIFRLPLREGKIPRSNS